MPPPFIIKLSGITNIIIRIITTMFITGSP
jgi:hypothetical protein